MTDKFAYTPAGDKSSGTGGGAAELNDLSDVTTGSESGGDVLIHDGSSGYQNRAIGGDATLSSTGTLTVTNDSHNHTILYNSSSQDVIRGETNGAELRDGSGDDPEFIWADDAGVNLLSVAYSGLFSAARYVGERNGTNLIFASNDSGGTERTGLEIDPDGSTIISHPDSGADVLVSTTTGVEVRDTSGSNPRITLATDAGVTIGWIDVSSGAVRIVDGSTTAALFSDGASIIYNSGNEKFRTTTSGIEVTGRITGAEYMVPIWAEENSTLGNNTYEWAFGNGANTPSNAGITIYVPSNWSCTIVAMTATTNNASGSSTIEANINGVLQGANCNVTLSGRSGTNDSFTPVSISSGDRLTFRTTTAGTNGSPSTVCAWLRYVAG